MPERKGIVEVVIKAKDLTAGVVSAFQRRWRAATRVLENTIRAGLQVTKTIAAMGASLVAATVGLQRLGAQGSKVIAVKQAFSKITGEETAALEQLRRSSRGAVSDFNLMANHNQALALGSAKTTEEFARQIEVVDKLARAQGLTLSEGLEKFNVALARQSKLRLDDLGIILDVEKANEDYAKSIGKNVRALTDAEKATAFRNTAMQKAIELAERIGTEENVGARAAERLAASFVNAKDRLAEFVAQSPEVAAFFDTIADTFDSLAQALSTGDFDYVLDALKAFGGMAGNAFAEAFLRAVQAAFNALDKMVLPGFLEKRVKTLFGVGGDFFGGIADTAAGNRQAYQVALGAAGRAAAASVAARGGAAGGGAPGAGAATRDPNLEWLAAWVAGTPLSGVTIDRIGTTLSARGLGIGGQVDAVRPRLVRAPGPVSATGTLPADLEERVAAWEMGLARTGDAVDATTKAVTAGFFSMAEAAVRGTDQVAVSVVNMITRMLQSIPSIGGGIGGVLLGGFGGLIGAVLSRRGERSNPVSVRVEDYADRALDRLKDANKRPVRIETTITLQDGTIVERVVGELYDRQNRDEVVRYNRGAPLVTR